MRTRLLSLALVTPLLVAASGSAAADPVHIAFEISVLTAHGALQEIFGAPIHIGDVIHGSVTYDPVASDHNPDPLYGSYLPSGEISIRQGSGLTLPLETLIVIDNTWGVGYPTDYLAAVSESSNLPGFSAAIAVAEFYGPPSGQNGDALPATAAAFRAMYSTRGSFQFSANKNGVEPPWDDTTHGFAGTFRFSDSTAPVPEPGTLLLIGTGVLGIGARHLLARQRCYRGTCTVSARSSNCEVRDAAQSGQIPFSDSDMHSLVPGIPRRNP